MVNYDESSFGFWMLYNGIKYDQLMKDVGWEQGDVIVWEVSSYLHSWKKMRVTMLQGRKMEMRIKFTLRLQLP